MNKTNNSFTQSALSADYTDSGTFSLGQQNYTGWGYWQEHYYPNVIRESYPVYIQDRAEDKGKKAFEIIKHLQDMKLVRLDKVSDFINAMDILIKIL